jgi:hypothetical protein
LHLSGGSQKSISRSAAAAQNFSFFFDCRRRRLKTIFYPAATAEFFHNFSLKTSYFRKNFPRKRAFDGKKSFHTKVAERAR